MIEHVKLQDIGRDGSDKTVEKSNWLHIMRNLPVFNPSSFDALAIGGGAFTREAIRLCGNAASLPAIQSVKICGSLSSIERAYWVLSYLPELTNDALLSVRLSIRMVLSGVKLYRYKLDQPPDGQ